MEANNPHKLKVGTKMNNFANMGKEALRQACRDAGISYSKLTNEGMRAVLQNADNEKNYDAQLVEYFGCTNCPECDIHLGNGVDTYNNNPSLTHQFQCLACDNGFGKKIVLPTLNVVKSTAPVKAGTKGAKIDKVLQERNGMKRPSAGTIGGRIWQAIDDFALELGGVPQIKQLIDLKMFENELPVNVKSIYARWRKFNGIVGRN